MVLKDFFADECGAVTADWVVLSAAVFSVAIATGSVVSGGVENLSFDIGGELADVDVGDGYRYFGTSYEDFILNAAWTTRTPQQQLNVYNTLVDPNERTDDQLRNGHRIWSDRAADENYGDRAMAAERVAVFEVALDARGVEPHDGY